MVFLAHFSFSWKKPLVKNIVNVIFWTFIIVGAYLLLFAQEPDWQYPRFQAAISFLSALFITLPFIVYRQTSLRHFYQKHFVSISEVLVTALLSLNALGALYFFNVSLEYDSLIHFINLILGTLLIFFVVGAFLKSHTVHLRIILFFIATAGAFFLGIGNEWWEHFSDAHFGTHSWGQVGQDPWYDTKNDIFSNTAGICVAAFLIFFWGGNWLSALRRFSPRVRAFAHIVKDKVQEGVHEKMVKSAKRIRNVKTAIQSTTQKTKKRLVRRSKRFFRREDLI